MVQTKIIAFFCLAAAAASCATQQQDFSYGWQKFTMDGHRTGVSAARNGQIDGTLGKIENGKYISPNGNEYQACTKKAAEIVLSVQDSMEALRTVIGHSVSGMVLDKPESALSDWVADSYIKITEDFTAGHIDVSLANFGGIRKDIPRGEIILDDITSMFPFSNYFCVVTMKGRDLWDMFDKMGKETVQIFGGMQLEYEDGRLVKAKVGGKALDFSKEYKMTTIDFLLDGGDNISVAQNAVSVVNTGLMVKDGFINYIKKMEARGESVDYQADGRLIQR